MSRLSSRPFLAFATVLFVAAIVLVPELAAAKERPFKARLTGNASLSPTDDPCVMRNDETGVGHATHLGRFTWQSAEFVDFCAVPGGVAVEGNFTMIAANGDQLFGEYVTVGFPDEAGDLIIHGLYRFTGGTGRFDDASGFGLLNVVASLAPGLPFEGVFRGTIDF